MYVVPRPQTLCMGGGGRVARAVLGHQTNVVVGKVVLGQVVHYLLGLGHRGI